MGRGGSGVMIGIPLSPDFGRNLLCFWHANLPQVACSMHVCIPGTFFSQSLFPEYDMSHCVQY